MENMLENHGKPWLREEEELLSKNFVVIQNIDEIARAHGRTAWAIFARLQKVGLIPADAMKEDYQKDSSEQQALTPRVCTPHIQSDSASVVVMTEMQSDYLPNHFPYDASYNILALNEQGKISIRLCNVLRDLEITDVRETLRFSDSQLLKRPNFGRKSLNELKALRKGLIVLANTDEATLTPATKLANEIVPAISKPSPSVDIEINYNWTWSGSTAQEILSELHNYIRVFSTDQRTTAILHARLGLNALNEPQTLQELGMQFSVSRERINQIFKKWITIVLAKIRRSQDHEQITFIMKCRRLFSNTEQPVMQAIYEFARAYYNPQQAIQITSVLFYVLGICTPFKKALINARHIASEYNAQHKQKLEKTLASHRIIQQWAAVINNAIYPATHVTFDRNIPFMTSRAREINESSDGITGFFFSRKCSRDIFYESGQELTILQILEKSPNVVWYQEQPVKIPYQFKSRNTTYTPDVAVVTDEGKGIVIEVKPLLNVPMFITLVKAIAAIEYLHARGIGYLIADRRGRSLDTLAKASTDRNVENALLTELDKLGSLTHHHVKLLEDQHGLNFEQLASIIIKNNLEYSTQPFCLKELEKVT